MSKQTFNVKSVKDLLSALQTIEGQGHIDECDFTVATLPTGKPVITVWDRFGLVTAVVVGPKPDKT
jgi:hypothetical protein